MSPCRGKPYNNYREKARDGNRLYVRLTAHAGSKTQFVGSNPTFSTKRIWDNNSIDLEL